MPGVARERPARRVDLGQAPVDPRAQLAHGRGRVALARAPRQRHRDLAVVLDAHAHRAGPLGAAHGVVEVAGHLAEAMRAGETTDADGVPAGAAAKPAYSTRSVASDVSRATIDPPSSRAASR